MLITINYTLTKEEHFSQQMQVHTSHPV